VGRSLPVEALTLELFLGRSRACLLQDFHPFPTSALSSSFSADFTLLMNVPTFCSPSPSLLMWFPSPLRRETQTHICQKTNAQKKSSLLCRRVGVVFAGGTKSVFARRPNHFCRMVEQGPWCCKWILWHLKIPGCQAYWAVRSGAIAPTWRPNRCL